MNNERIYKISICTQFKIYIRQAHRITVYIVFYTYNIYGKVNVIEIRKLYFDKVMNTATMMLTLYFY